MTETLLREKLRVLSELFECQGILGKAPAYYQVLSNKLSDRQLDSAASWLQAHFKPYGAVRFPLPSNFLEAAASADQERSDFSKTSIYAEKKFDNPDHPGMIFEAGKWEHEAGRDLIGLWNTCTFVLMPLLVRSGAWNADTVHSWVRKMNEALRGSNDDYLKFFQSSKFHMERILSEKKISVTEKAGDLKNAGVNIEFGF
jgi:hypothetical protein